MRRRTIRVTTVILGLTTLTLAILSSCGLLKQLGGFTQPTMTFKNLHLLDVSFSAMTLDFEFEVENKNSVGLTLASLDYQLDIDSNTLLEGNQQKDVQISAKGKSPVRVPLTIEFTKFVDSLSAFFSDNEEIPYRLIAKFGIKTPAGVVRIPLDIDGMVPLPKLPAISFGGVTLDKMGLTGADLSLSLNVANKSKFPVKINGANYGIQVAGVKVTDGEMKIPTLKAGQTATTAVPLHLNFLKLGTSIVNVIKDRRFPYHITGALDLGLLDYPFELKGNTTF